MIINSCGIRMPLNKYLNTRRNEETKRIPSIQRKQLSAAILKSREKQGPADEQSHQKR